MADLPLVPVSPHLGADVPGVDLGAAIDAGDIALLDAMRRALDTHILLRFREQVLTPRQIERLGRHFGPLMNLKRPNGNAHHVEGVAYLKIISNAVAADGRPVGDGSNAPQDWHSDGAAKPVPGGYTYFYARKVPPAPPRTYWMNAHLAYEALPHRMKARIAGLEVIHHEYPAGNEFPLPPSKPLAERLVGARHPLVRLHPATGRPTLFPPHRDDMLVVGLSEEASAALIAELRALVAAMPFWWSTAMAVDDLVVWDNRAALHRRDGWDGGGERIIWHLANIGEPPVPFAPSKDIS
jgi:taurine dioxygenase